MTIENFTPVADSHDNYLDGSLNYWDWQERFNNRKSANFIQPVQEMPVMVAPKELKKPEIKRMANFRKDRYDLMMAGKTDQEIADAEGTSVYRITEWRKKNAFD